MFIFLIFVPQFLNILMFVPCGKDEENFFIPPVDLPADYLCTRCCPTTSPSARCMNYFFMYSQYEWRFQEYLKALIYLLHAADPH